PKRGAGLVASLALIVTACGNAATPSPAASTPASAPPPASAGGSPSAAAQNFAGTTVNVLTFTGPQIAEPLQRRGPDFTKLTGATINVVTVPFADLYQTILKDAATKTNSYQAYVLDPQWMPDFIVPGYLQDLSDSVKADKDLQWEDVGQFFREFSASYAGKVYAIPLDGDFHMLYYRIDILKAAGL